MGGKLPLASRRANAHETGQITTSVAADAQAIGAEKVGGDALDMGATIADIENRGRRSKPALQHAIPVIIVGSCMMERGRKELAVRRQACGRLGKVRPDAIGPEGEARVGSEQHGRLARFGMSQEDEAFDVGAAKREREECCRRAYPPSRASHLDSIHRRQESGIAATRRLICSKPAEVEPADRDIPVDSFGDDGRDPLVRLQRVAG